MREYILMIAPEEAGRAVATALRRQLDVTVEVVGTRRAGLAALRSADWSLIVLEESLSGNDPETAELLYLNAGAACVLEMNFAITNATRAVRQVRAALSRRVQERVRAKAAAAAALQGELRSTLSGLLLESELALKEAPPGQQAKLRQVVKLAIELRSHLSV